MSGSEVPSGKRILVVDDEAPLAALMADILSADGHTVDIAVNGLAALAHIERGTYDLILSDLRMPELDGPGLYRELERRQPELARRIAFVTGSAQSVGMEHFLQKTGAPILYKPFRIQDLQKLVSDLLERYPRLARVVRCGHALGPRRHRADAPRGARRGAGHPDHPACRFPPRDLRARRFRRALHDAGSERHRAPVPAASEPR